jgi:hypothetical protein
MALFSTDSFCVELVALVDAEASNAKRSVVARTSDKDVCPFRTEVASPHSFAETHYATARALWADPRKSTVWRVAAGPSRVSRILNRTQV